MTVVRLCSSSVKRDRPARQCRSRDICAVKISNTESAGSKTRIEKELNNEIKMFAYVCPVGGGRRDWCADVGLCR